MSSFLFILKSFSLASFKPSFCNSVPHFLHTHIVVHINVLHLFSFSNRQSLYERGKNYVDNCSKAQVAMDDVLPGVIIEAILGVEITNIPEIIDQTYKVPGTDPAWYKSKVWI